MRKRVSLTGKVGHVKPVDHDIIMLFGKSAGKGFTAFRVPTFFKGGCQVTDSRFIRCVVFPIKDLNKIDKIKASESTRVVYRVVKVVSAP